MNLFEDDPNWFKYEDASEYDYSDVCILGDHKMIEKSNIPENGVYKINKGVVFHDGLSCSEEFKLFKELHWFGNEKDYFHSDEYIETFYKREICNLKKIKGKCLNLLSAWADVNYGHFILDVATRFEIIEKVSPIKFKEFDCILMPQIKSPIFDYIIKDFDISKSQIIKIERSDQYQFDELYCPSLRGKRRISRIGSFNRIIQNYCFENNNCNKRLYVSREGYSRNIENESDVWNILKHFGFQKIDPKKEINCFDLFNSASIIVGCHGAGLTDMFCCKKNTIIIELIPYNHCFPYYMSLAYACGLSYYGLIFGDKNNSNVRLNELKDILIKVIGKFLIFMVGVFF